MTLTKALLIAAMPLALGSLGCRRARPTPATLPADVVTTTGAARVQEPAPQTATPQDMGQAASRFEPLRNSAFKASARAGYPVTSSGEVQRITVARAAARREALRRLTRDALNFQIGGGETLGSLVRSDPDRAEKLNDLIESRSDIVFYETTGGEEAEASISGALIHETLTLDALQPPAPPPAVVDAAERERLRESALQQAADQARDTLFARMLETPVGEGTLKNEIERNPNLDRRLREMIERLTPLESYITADGEARVTFSLDRNAAAMSLLGEASGSGRR